MKYKSYIEPQDIPTTGIKDFNDLLPKIKYGNISHNEKPEIIVIKESILLRNDKGNKIGVFTRSEKDHRSTVGDCSVLLHNDFCKDECRVDNFNRISYDINDRLHEHFGSFSSSFTPVKSKNSILIHYTNPRTNKKYIFVIFEMICNDYPPPMFLKLKTRSDDAFIGMQDLKDVNIGIKKYNKTPIEVDSKIVELVKPSIIGVKNKSLLNNNNKLYSALEVNPSVNGINLTLVKVNLFGIG